MIIPYKNRTFDPYKPVEFYRCLNRKGRIFSLRQNGLVVGHTDKIVLINCEMVINKAGKNRCLTTGERCIHAFIRGYVTNTEEILNSFSFHLRYDPFSRIGFYSPILGEINKASVVYIQNENLYCQL